MFLWHIVFCRRAANGGWHGYSRDHRPDCVQVIALIITPDGLPLAYEVLPGNTSDKTTLKGFWNASKPSTARPSVSG